MNGANFVLADDDFDDAFATGTNNGAVDPAFRQIKKNHAAFLIWRIEKLHVVAVPKEQYNTFFDTDCYIIFAASQYGQSSGPNAISRELKTGAEYHIHFWLGGTTTPDKAAAAAYKTVELDTLLGGVATQHREVQGSESPRFKSYFQKMSIRILTGGTNTVFKHVSHCFEPALYRVKGQRAPIITQMPSISWIHFNSGDVFLLHTQKTIYVWVGRASNHTEKLYAAKVAMVLKTENNTPNIVFVDDGYEKTLHAKDIEEIEIYLPFQKRYVKPVYEEQDDAIAAQNYRGNIKLYQCSDSSGKYRVTEVKSGPLKQTDLNSNDVFILDHGIYGIWIWVGKRASDKERTEAMRNARGFVKKKKYPGHTAVTRIVDGAEPFEFKMLFTGWKHKDEIIGLVKNMVKPVSKVKVTKFDAETMYDRPALAAKSQLLDDGSGTMKKYMITNGDIMEIPKERNSVFFSSDCYIIIYKYKNPVRENVIIYYWLGLYSNEEDQGCALLRVLKIDFEGGTRAHIGRAVQGREPPHFLQIFKGKMRVFLGKSTDLDPTGCNLKTTSHYLLQVEGSASYNTKASQVTLKASSLNSNYCFVLRKGSHYYVWCGNNSNGDNREMAKAFAGSDFALILEGSENPEFWYAIGGKGEYFTAKILNDPSDHMPARLFQCTTFDDVLKCEEILNFTQQDLNTENIRLLDINSSVYIWTGALASKEERHFSLSTTIEYIKSDPANRDKYTCIQQVKQNLEPPTFTGFFESWDPNMWKDQKTYYDLRDEIEKQNESLSRTYIPGLKLPGEFDSFPKYPISVVTGPKDLLPSAINPLKREVHLTFDDFITVTNMTYEVFKNLPYWKQQGIKKEVGLF